MYLPPQFQEETAKEKSEQDKNAMDSLVVPPLEQHRMMYFAKDCALQSVGTSWT